MSQSRLRSIVVVGVFSALAIALMAYVRFPMFLPYLIYEPADVPILIIGFALGPVYGLIMTAVVAGLMIPLEASGGVFGGVMHFLATGALVGTSSLIYRKYHTIKGAVLGLALGTLAMVAVMVPANIILTPIFYGIPASQVMAVIWSIVAFNAVKAGLNSLVTFLLYKRVSGFIRSFAGVTAMRKRIA